MAHSYHHAVSSARKFGGVPERYQAVHDWLDASKLILADLDDLTYARAEGAHA